MRNGSGSWKNCQTCQTSTYFSTLNIEDVLSQLKVDPRILGQAYTTRSVSLNRYFARGVSRKNHQDALATLWCQSQASSETSVGGCPAGDVGNFRCFFLWTANWQTSTNWHELPSKGRKGDALLLVVANWTPFLHPTFHFTMWRAIVGSSSQHFKQRISVSVVPGWFVLMSGLFPIHTVGEIGSPWQEAQAPPAPPAPQATRKMPAENCNRNIVQGNYYSFACHLASFTDSFIIWIYLRKDAQSLARTAGFSFMMCIISGSVQ